MRGPKRILIFSTASGFCHRATSNAIELILKDISVNINIVEFYDYFGNLKFPFTSKLYSVPAIYNKYIQQKGNTGFIWIISFLIFLIILKKRGKKINSQIDKLLLETKPDMVISTIPLVNKLLCERISIYSEGLKLHTIVVDFCQPFPRIWLQSKKQVIYGWDRRLMKQAKDFGISQSNIVNLGGQLISPKLKEVKRNERNNAFIVFVIWGGNGSKRVLKYAQQLEKTDNKIEINYIVGHNENLYNNLYKILRKNNSKIYKFFSDVTNIYSKSNLIIGKPGPGLISESIFTNVPLLLELNRKTLIQERYNAKWAKAVGVALLFKSSYELKIKLEQLAFEPHYYEQLKINTYKLPNTSFEIFKKSIIETLN